MSGIAEKMLAAGYATGQAGKWHIGLATPDHTVCPASTEGHR